MNSALFKDKTRPSKATQDSKKIKTSPEESPTYQFQVQTARSQHWFNLDPDWIEYNFMTR